MKLLYPPIVLVETWLFIETSTHPSFEQQKKHARYFINMYFGCISVAEMYIEEQLTKKSLNIK